MNNDETTGRNVRASEIKVGDMIEVRATRASETVTKIENGPGGLIRLHTRFDFTTHRATDEVFRFSR